MKISIVIPTYARTDLLDRVLEGIIRQTFREYEIIVVDDASAKEKEYQAVINKYRSRFEEFTYLRNFENKGAPFSRNKGIREAKYEWIALVDDDDEWLPTKLEKQVAECEKGNEKLGIVYTWADAINDKKEITFRYRSKI